MYPSEAYRKLHDRTKDLRRALSDYTGKWDVPAQVVPIICSLFSALDDIDDERKKMDEDMTEREKACAKQD